MVKQKKSKAPLIRFKGFEGEWVEHKLGDAMIDVANNTLSRANLNYRFGIAKNVHYGDILIRFGDVLDAQDDAVPFVSDNELARKLKSSNLENGDVVFADAAEDETVGKCTEIRNVGDHIILAGLHTIALRPRSKFAPFYLGYYLNSAAFHDQLLPIMQGTKVLSISKTAIKRTLICFPTEGTEQAKVGEFSRELDRLIVLQRSKHDKLVTLKKAMLQKMFPQPGTTTPEIRFKGFVGPWAEARVSNICGQTYGGGTPRTSERELWEGAIPWIQSSDVTIGEIFKVSRRKHINDLALQKSATKLIPENSIAIVTRVGVGKLVLMGFSYATSQDFLSLSELKIDQTFAVIALSILLQTKLHETQGTSIKGLTKEELLAYTLTIPANVSEQHKIGIYFRTLDELVSKHAIQLEKLKQLKSACLEKMFV